MTGWIDASLGEVATLQRGFDLPTRLRRRGSVPIISSSGTSGWHDRAMVKGPGVVTGRYGTIGEVFFERTDFWPLNTTLWVSDFHGNDEEFVYYLLQRVDFATHSGKSGVPGVNRNDLHAERVSLPPSFAAQRQIAEALQDADHLAASLERLIAKKRDIKQGMTQELLTGCTRLPGFEGEWRDVTLGDHVAYVRTVALSREQLDQGSPLRYLHYGDIHTRKSVHLDAATEFMPRAASHLASRAGRLIPGDLVFADASEDPDGVGKSVEISGVPPEGVVPGLHTIAARFDKSVLADGFKAYVQFIPAFRAALLRLAAGTKVLATTRSYISSIELTLPGAGEQHAIAQVLQDADAEISALEGQLESARGVKVGMMQELLTGRTRLPAKEEV
ncbi:restriction endonuclease subunit S [Glutamicibacter ardleyensis]|uniref:restriction endonuclease subunit S n=1 Tax=Glutamicibacter ardleyensis TaxID=225894 RepID=UPI003FD013FC